MRFFVSFCFAAGIILGAANLLAEPVPYPTGRITLKAAVIVYNPLISNTFENAHGSVLSEELGYWGNPTNMVYNNINWWRNCSRGMVNFEVVYWTNLYNVARTMPGREGPARRPSVQEIWDAARLRQDRHFGHQDEFHTLTNDVPYVWEAIKKGEVDQVWQIIFPFGPGGWETLMQGAGASWCNSPGRYVPLERTFMGVYPTTERPETPMENFGHAFESLISTYYGNGHDWDFRPQDNEWSLFIRMSANTNDISTHVGCVHFAPNSLRDYQLGRDKIVKSYAQGWLRYPDMLKMEPVDMNTRFWGGGVNYNHKQWFFYHAPMRYGIYKGHLMNWMTLFFNLNTAAYPITPGETLKQEVDPSGWFTFRVHAPAGTTAVVFRVESPEAPLHSGIRKTYIPKRHRNVQEPRGKAWDEFTEKDERVTEKVWVINSEKDYAKEIEGDWFFTCGGGEPRVGTVPLSVTAEVLPKPPEEPLEVKVTMPEAITGDEAQIVWEATEPKVGLRGIELSYSESGDEGPFTPFCHDYAFQLTSPYRWFLPAGSVSNACIKVEIEDCYGRKASATSKVFSINLGREWQMYDVPHLDDAWGDRMSGVKAGTDGKGYYYSNGNVENSPLFFKYGEGWQRKVNFPNGKDAAMGEFAPYQDGFITSAGYECFGPESNRFLASGFVYYDSKKDKWEEGLKQRRAPAAAITALNDGTILFAEKDGANINRLDDWKKGEFTAFEALKTGGSYVWAATTDGKKGYFAKFNGRPEDPNFGSVIAVDKDGNQELLPEPPFNPGAGCSIAFVPGKLFKDGADRLYLVRGGHGYRRPWLKETGVRMTVDTYKDNLAIYNFATKSWTLETLPVPTDEGSRLTLVGNKLYLLGAANIHMPLRIKEFKAE